MSNDFVNWYSTKNVKSRLYWAFEGIVFDIRIMLSGMPIGVKSLNPWQSKST